MTQRVSLDQAREGRSAYFYHWFGKHWDAITGRKDGSNYSSLPSLSVPFFLSPFPLFLSFLAPFSKGTVHNSSRVLLFSRINL